MRRRFLLIGLVLLLALSGCANFGQSDPDQYREMLEVQRERERAMAMAEPAKQPAPDTVEERIAEGDRYAATDDPAHAYWQYLEAHRLDPKHPDPLVRLGYVALKEDSERAASLFARAVELAPERADAHAGLGLARLLQGRLPEARAALERAVELDPSSWAAHDALGVVYALEDDGERGREQGQRAIELSPRDARIVNNLGVSYLEDQNWLEAERAFRTATLLDPSVPAYYNNLGLVLGRQERYEEAMRAFERFGDEQAAYNNLGYAYYLNADYTKAVEHYERALHAKGSDRERVLRNLQEAAAAASD